MAFTKTAFDLNAALAGAINIWTRDEQPVRFGGYNEDAAANQQVSVWIGQNDTPANYNVSGLVNQQGTNALDLMMYTQDTAGAINIFLNQSVYYSESANIYADLTAAQNAGQSQPNYSQSIVINYQTPYNNPDV